MGFATPPGVCYICLHNVSIPSLDHLHWLKSIKWNYRVCWCAAQCTGQCCQNWNVDRNWEKINRVNCKTSWHKRKKPTKIWKTKCELRTAKYEIGTRKHSARLHEAKAGGSRGAGDGVDLTFCRLWRNAHTIGARRAAFGTAHEAHTSSEQRTVMRRRRPRLRLQLSQVFSWSSVFSLRFELDAPTTQRDDEASSKRKKNTKPSRAPKCALNW